MAAVIDQVLPALLPLLVALVALLVGRVRARIRRERAELLAAHEEKPTPLPAARPSRPSHAERRVLIVDDERAIATALVRLLRQDLPGLDVEIAQSGAEALAIFDRHELLVVDVGMPGMSGPELVRRLVEAGHLFRVVVISGRAPEALGAIAEQVGELGVEVRFLAKPFEAEQLVAVVRELLRL